jgi:diguanylate cyclase (GGDEF)-like protein
MAVGMATSISKAPEATLRKAAHIQRLLEPGSIEPVYQPIVRLTDLQAVGYEGLARFPYADGMSHLPPDVTLAAAGEIGLREDLEVACWAAMANAGAPPAGRLLFVNISPDALGHPGLLALADKLPSRLVIEITEQRAVQDYEALREQLAPWVARGAAVAIDDAGAGYASLEHVVEMRPDFLKLTRGLIAEIDKDANRQALLRALAAFAGEVGATIVAEGVERREELEVLREAEVGLAQGWLFGKPAAPWPDVLAVEPGSSASKPKLTESGVMRLGKIERDVAGAPTAKRACEAAIAHLGRMGMMPSVYLEQGGKLRCQGAAGYWQVFDGMALEAGVIGRVFRSGESCIIADVAKSPEYLSMVNSVKAEVGLPLKIGSKVVGVLNVESPTPLGDQPVAEIRRVAGLLQRRLAELSPLDRPTAGQRLARAASRAAAGVDRASVIAEAAGAALEVAGMESAAVVMRDEQDTLVVEHAKGPFEDLFRGLTVGELGAMASWVEAGTTVMTMGVPAGKGPTATDGLRRAGAGALVVVPMSVGGQQLGFLALADRSSVVLDIETTELVELLGVQAAAQIRGVAAVEALLERATRDPLTGLGHQKTFEAKLPKRREAAARKGRQLAVVLADVDGFKRLNDRQGENVGDEILRVLAGLLEELAPEGASAYRLGGDEFALVMEARDRGAPQEIAWQLQAQARERLGATLSIGVAVAADGESDSDLLSRADAAVSEVKRRGRDGVAVAPSRTRRKPPRR